FFLPEPPDEPLPVPDFRTIRDEPIARPSADLLETLYLCQDRQDWFSYYLRTERGEPLGFVGSTPMRGSVARTADAMRGELGFSVEARRGASFAEAFTLLRRRAEDIGVVVMTSGIVGNATRRRLDPEEFRGFALVDTFAPLVFV